MKIGAVVVGFNHWHNTSVQDGQYTRNFCHDLQEKNPDMQLVVIDNASDERYPYQSDTLNIIRLTKRVGYGVALNAGLRSFSKPCDLYITFNNDCQVIADGNIARIASLFDEKVLYGSGWNVDTKLNIRWQSSAWLCISNKIFRNVGYFDNNLEAAFEDFDYEYRAMEKGFALDTAHLPVEHLDMHTRYEDLSYPKRWEAARLYFQQKHGLEMEKWYKNV